MCPSLLCHKIEEFSLIKPRLEPTFECRVTEFNIKLNCPELNKTEYPVATNLDKETKFLEIEGTMTRL